MPVAPVEIEIKLPARNAQAVIGELPRRGFQLHRSRRLEVNWMFDDDNARIRTGGCLLRLRHSGEDWFVTAKGPACTGKYKAREERETQVADGEAFRAILNLVGLRERFVYERYRTTWERDGGELALDETPLGDFWELEGREEWIDEVARELGCTPADYLTASYARLFREHVAANGLTIDAFTFEAFGAQAHR